MRDKISKAGLDNIHVDSAGTGGWHIGKPPFEGTRRKLDKMNISYEGIRARILTKNDFLKFDYIYGLDSSNVRDIRDFGDNKYNDKIYLLSELVPDAGFTDVPDPWYTGDFDLAFKLINLACDALLKKLTENTVK